MARWHRDRIFIGIGSHVVAISKDSGHELWRTKLKMSSFTTVMVDRDAIYAGASGEVFCLDPDSGNIRWRNKLPRLGLGVVSFSDSTTAAAMAASHPHG
jgi:outer membrane protein assembly factor BamB